MVGTQFRVYSITSEEAAKIRKRQKIVNKACVYAAGAGALVLAAESLYRNLGGSPEIANYLFQTGMWTFGGTITAAVFNNQETVLGPETSEKDSLESKV